MQKNKKIVKLEFDLIMVDRIKLDDPSLVRPYKDTEMSGLVNSIKSGGLINPIFVTTTTTKVDISSRQYNLLDGQHRVLAYKLLKKMNIPAIVRFDDMSGEQRKTVQATAELFRRHSTDDERTISYFLAQKKIIKNRLNNEFYMNAILAYSNQVDEKKWRKLEKLEAECEHSKNKKWRQLWIDVLDWNKPYYDINTAYKNWLFLAGKGGAEFIEGGEDVHDKLAQLGEDLKEKELRVTDIKFKKGYSNVRFPESRKERCVNDVYTIVYGLDKYIEGFNNQDKELVEKHSLDFEKLKNFRNGLFDFLEKNK